MQLRDAKSGGKDFSHKISQPFADSQAFNFVQSSGAFDASCSWFCGKETIRILLSISHMLVCADGAREERRLSHKES